jgi:hypothetical protein
MTKKNQILRCPYCKSEQLKPDETSDNYFCLNCWKEILTKDVLYVTPPIHEKKEKFVKMEGDITFTVDAFERAQRDILGLREKYEKRINEAVDTINEELTVKIQDVLQNAIVEIAKQNPLAIKPEEIQKKHWWSHLHLNMSKKTPSVTISSEKSIPPVILPTIPEISKTESPKLDVKPEIKSEEPRKFVIDLSCVPIIKTYPLVVEPIKVEPTKVEPVSEPPIIENKLSPEPIIADIFIPSEEADQNQFDFLFTATTKIVDLEDIPTENKEIKATSTLNKSVEKDLKIQSITIPEISVPPTSENMMIQKEPGVFVAAIETIPIIKLTEIKIEPSVVDIKIEPAKTTDMQKIEDKSPLEKSNSTKLKEVENQPKIIEIKPDFIPKPISVKLKEQINVQKRKPGRPQKK